MSLLDSHVLPDGSMPLGGMKEELSKATGWAGYNNWNCAFGITSSSFARVNDYYNANLASNEGRIRVIWLHEIGHGLGLDHVSTVARVMYTPTSSAYNAGVRNLTFDEINGINALY